MKDNYLQIFKLWEDLGNWCSALKKKARTLVREHYKWDAQNCHQVNADLARDLLECGNFLKSGADEEVSGKLRINHALIVS